MTSVGALAMMMNTKKVVKKRKEGKRVEPKRDTTPQVVTRRLGDNTYTGIIREDPLGSQFLETGTAKYVWNTGIRYEGPFAASQIEGRGKYSWPDGSSYEGELRAGKRHGEGSYMGADGTTKYEGQWRMGKREGRGRLTYETSVAYYDGEWKEGKKHGEGKQVWPSGNVYEGQWLLSKMSGFGTMTWRAGNTVEQYKGYWEDNHPHGEGTHTWLAGEPAEKDREPVRSPPITSQHQQQQNNRYSGQWLRGKRDGVGTFYYANGAYYHGEWHDHVKHGHGRHVFEDGQIYEGPFDNDRMTDYKAPSDVDENPVRRRLDVSDLEVVALPADHCGFEATAGSGYLDAAKILKGVCNTLLRNLSELKELYNRYRALLPWPGEDPFILKNHQLWMLARDAGLVTPLCPLSRLHRFIFNGPRHHRETAPQESRNARPLTPRPKERRGSLDSVSDGSVAFKPEEEEPASPTSPHGGSSEEEDSGSLDSSRQSPANEGSEKSDSSANLRAIPLSLLTNSSGMRYLCRRIGVSEVPSKRSSAVVEVPPPPDLEPPGPSASTEIHHPTKSLLFRQFLDGVVRTAAARFPHERGLEVQLQRLFRERLMPTHAQNPSSEHVWSFLIQPAFRQILAEFEPALLRLFRGAVAGRDLRPLDDPEAMHRLNVFGAPRRQRFRCLARVDETVRLKDVLRLLHRLNLLRPFATNAFPEGNPFVPIGDLEEEEAAEEGRQSDDEAGGGRSGNAAPEPDGIDETSPKGLTLDGSEFEARGFFDARAPFDSRGPPFGVGPSTLSFMPKSSLLADEERQASPSVPPRRKRMRPKVVEVAKPPEERSAARAEDLSRCDARASPLAVLSAVSLAMAAGALDSVYWELEPDAPADRLSLLEFLETELVFAEFERLLLQLAGTATSGVGRRLSMPRRFEGFLRFVFLPALAAPYRPPDPPLRSEPEGVSTASAAGSLPSFHGSMTESHVPEEQPVAEAEEPQRMLELWGGFDEGTAMVDVVRAQRRWVTGYEQQVLAWQ